MEGDDRHQHRSWEIKLITDTFHNLRMQPAHHEDYMKVGQEV